ncbi:MAG TPA: potassium/proton antiporter [Xanthobacteraceae bacterium]|nr:potassium/proton antiporter [Xanthobacteraceae bacterium]
MAALDTLTLTILLGALLVLAGIVSSLIALRFGVPLLLVFLFVGLFAGEAGPGGIKFDDVASAYMVGAVALGLILFDGGLRTRLPTFRSVMAPAALLATLGVLLTAAVVAPVARLTLGLSWLESLLTGAVIASTDAAAVFFLMHSRGLRLRPRVAATLEVESGTNDPFAIFLTLLLVQILLVGETNWPTAALELARKALIGLFAGIGGGRAAVYLLNRFNLPQGLHGVFVATAALVIFAAAEAFHGSGYLAAYVAGLVVGNRPTRAHGTIIVFLDATTWLAQLVMFVILGLLVWPQRLPATLPAALAVALTLMLVARPAAVFLCLAPFRYAWREKLFISWVGLRGAVGIFLASIPLLVGLPKATVYFDVAFVVVVVSLLVQGWSLSRAAERLHLALPRIDNPPRRVELDLPGQLEQELVGYLVRGNCLYLRRRVIPSWAKLALVVRKERVLSPAEAGEIREGDYAYFLAPPAKAPALDRFFVDMPQPSSPDERLLGDFYVPGDVTLGALAEIYGLQVGAREAGTSLADWFDEQIEGGPNEGDSLPLGAIELIVDKMVDGRVATVGLDLADHAQEDVPDTTPLGRVRGWLKKAAAELWPSSLR